MKHLLPLLLLCCLLPAGCSSDPQQSEELITIDLSAALKNQKDFRLSDLVKKVELLELQHSSGIYLSQPLVRHYGERYILVFDYDTRRVFLYRRDGGLVCEIGQKGQGPGEHERHIICAMDPEEQYVVITDSRASKVMVFDTTGSLLIQKDLSEHFPPTLIDKVEWIMPGAISFLPRRVSDPNRNYASVVLFDENLNFIRQVLPRPDDENLLLHNLMYFESFSDGEHAWYWETYLDTLYQYDTSGACTPRYRIDVGENKITSEVLSGSDFSQIYQYSQVAHVSFMGPWLHIMLLEKGTRGPVMRPVWFNTTTRESFTLTHRPRCKKGDDPVNEGSYSIENDLFGLEQLNYFVTFPAQQLAIHALAVDLTDLFQDIACIKALDVQLPEIRDRLVQAVEEPAETDGTLLVLMHLK